jgi:hypothetical protein
MKASTCDAFSPKSTELKVGKISTHISATGLILQADDDRPIGNLAIAQDPCRHRKSRRSHLLYMHKVIRILRQEFSQSHKDMRYKRSLCQES